jgi:hypothetical protein
MAFYKLREFISLAGYENGTIELHIQKDHLDKFNRLLNLKQQGSSDTKIQPTRTALTRELSRH